MGHGIKYALKLGGMWLKSMHKQFLDKPRLPFEGDSVTGTAARDPWNSLKSGQCHVFAGERWLEGWFVVWRFPVMLPSDVRLWEAKAPPPQARNFPRNTIICNREEDTVTKASGGDTDGDGLCLTNDPRMVDLVRTTPDGHERVEASIARPGILDSRARGGLHQVHLPGVYGGRQVLRLCPSREGNFRELHLHLS